MRCSTYTTLFRSWDCNFTHACHFVTDFAQWTFSSHAEEQNGAEQVYQGVIIQGCRLTPDSI